MKNKKPALLFLLALCLLPLAPTWADGIGKIEETIRRILTQTGLTAPSTSGYVWTNDGTTGGWAAGGGGSYPAPSASQMVYVAKGGNDTTGNGTPPSPYLTISKALTTIADATVNKQYVVFVGPGTFAGNFAIKPYTTVRGAGAGIQGMTSFAPMPSDTAQTIVSGVVTVATWATDATASFQDIEFTGTETFDLSAFDHSMALCFTRCAFSGDTLTATAATAQVQQIHLFGCQSARTASWVTTGFNFRSLYSYVGNTVVYATTDNEIRVDLQQSIFFNSTDPGAHGIKITSPGPADVAAASIYITGCVAGGIESGLDIEVDASTSTQPFSVNIDWQSSAYLNFTPNSNSSIGIFDFQNDASYAFILSGRKLRSTGGSLGFTVGGGVSSNPFVSSTQSSVQNSSDEVTIFQQVVDAGTAGGTKEVLHFNAVGKILSKAISPGNITIKAYWGSDSITVYSGALVAADGEGPFTLDVWLQTGNGGLAAALPINTQYMDGSLLKPTLATRTLTPASGNVSVTFKVTVQFTVADNTNVYQGNAQRLEVLR